MEQMNNKQQLAEDYGKTWLGSDIAWAAAQSGFIAGWEACQQNLQQTPCTEPLPQLRELIYEQDLPDDITTDEYNKWHDRSFLVYGVRMGYPLKR